MFDLLGILDFQTHQAPPLPSGVLPAQRWGKPDLPVHTVSAQRLAAQFIVRAIGDPAYHTADGLHLFIVGEARLRSDAPQSSSGNPLSANSLLAFWRAEPAAFIRRLKGNFTLVLVNANLRKVKLYNSRFGISPFYYALDGGRFIFSTSLAAVAACLSSVPVLDHAAVAELALFSYPLGDRTYFLQVKMLRPAEVVRADGSGLRRDAWWDVRTLYDVPLLPEPQALEHGSELFRKTVNGMAADAPKLRLSFTSGFDSRAILAALEREPADVLGYSFGIPGSLNVSIPEKLCTRLGQPFSAIYLDGGYERVFDQYARRAVLLSDCLSTVERANYPYAFERLADFSPVVITGLFGSELMRTFQNVGHIVSANLARLNLVDDPLTELKQIINASGTLGYFAPDLFRQAMKEIEADVATALVERFGEMPPDRRFYMFLLTEGLRKYFGAEIHMERPWGINRFPFLDDEFVEFAFRAPFAGVHSRTLWPTVSNRYRSQRFYAYVIRKYRPELLSAPTDHGYSPGDVLSPLALARIGPRFLLWKWRRERTGYREFKTEEWTATFYRRHLFGNAVRSDLFSPRLAEDFRSGAWLANRLEFAKAASFKAWLEALGI